MVLFRHFLFVYCLLLIAIINIYFVSATRNPVVGVMAQEIFPHWVDKYPGKTQYIASSYVKAVEGSGARVVPIFIGRDEDYYRRMLSSVNGLVLPGGGCYCSRPKGYCQSWNIMYKIILEMNEEGDFFPVLGICLGFEFMLTVANDMNDIQTSCQNRHINFPLHFRPQYRQSLLYSNIPLDIFMILKHMNVTFNSHRLCTTPSNFTRSALSRDWIITTDNIDLSGLKFISSIEHRKYPLLAVQFHPEKIMYEWFPNQNIPHTYFAVKANRYFYDVIVNLSKLNNHEFPDAKTLSDNLIYNYAELDTTNSSLFVQAYLFE